MHKFNEEKILAFSALDIFNIILDVKSYAQFLPWCEKARVISQNKDEIIAELVISFKGFSESYESKITTRTDDGYYGISVVAISGPFKHLSNFWEITVLDEKKCLVKIKMEFEFKSFILNKVAGGAFVKVTDKMVKSFEERARAILQ